MNIATVNSAGENFYDTLVSLFRTIFWTTIHLGHQAPGDLWYFPPGVPHVLQATADLPQGAEFLLVSTERSDLHSNFSHYQYRCSMMAISAKIRPSLSVHRLYC